MRLLFSILAGLVLLLPAGVNAVDIDNPYVKPLAPPAVPIPAPSFQQAPPAPGDYQPRPITPDRPPEIKSGPSVNHIQWCQNNYRSYRLSDNSYIPLSGGGRVSCNSPFGP